MGRRGFLAGTAAAAAASLVACSTGDGERADGAGRRHPRRHALTQRGINYDTGMAFFPDLDPTALTRTVWQTEYVRREIDAITDDLHCNAILVLGSDHDRLMEAATIAAERQLYVWIEPRFPDFDAAETAAHLGDLAQAAEALRAEHPDVGIALGCELSIFMDGLVPGDTWQDRIATLVSGTSGDYDTSLNAFLAEAATEVRRTFGGQLTYSSGPWEQVDWSPLDLVGVDLYRDASNTDTYEQEVSALRSFGKPVIITELGCCAFRGAAERGADGWSVVEHGSDPPIPSDLVRDEHVQADYIDELLTVFESERVHGAFVYNFVEPDMPHHPDPHYDLDLGSYGVVKCYPDGHERSYATTGEWDPKAAVAVIADHYR